MTDRSAVAARASRLAHERERRADLALQLRRAQAEWRCAESVLLELNKEIGRTDERIATLELLVEEAAT
jgi:hypothetical protein